MPTEMTAMTEPQSVPVSGFAGEIYGVPRRAENEPDITYSLGQSLAAFDASSAVTERLSATIARLIGAAASPSGRDWIPTTYHVLHHRRELVSASNEFETGYPQFASSLKALFDEHDVEDGQAHEAETWIRGGLSRFGAPFSRWLEDLARGVEGSVSVGVLRCIGRLSEEIVTPWGTDLAISLLNADAVEIRDACVRALEYWGGDKAAQALRGHRETIPWLSDYIRRVVRDLDRRP